MDQLVGERCKAMQAEVEFASNAQIELLEMRISRLERIFAAQVFQPAEHLALTAPVTYSMDDPRLVFFGAYGPESKDGMVARWFGKEGQAQMVFPHGRGTAQTARLLIRPFRDVDPRQLRPIVDEAVVVPRLSPAASPPNASLMEISLPPAYGFQTEIQMHGLPLRVPKDFGVQNEKRVLSFLLYSATFIPST